MRKLLCLVVVSTALAGCGVGSITGLIHIGGPSTPAKIVTGGQGLNVNAGRCIGPRSTISSSDSLSATVTVISQGPSANTYLVKDNLGNKTTGNAGKAVGFDQAHINLVSPAPPIGVAQSFAFVAAH